MGQSSPRIERRAITLPAANAFFRLQ